MEYLSLKDQLLRERERGAALNAAHAQNTANIEYIAMMCDVELETDETGGDTKEDD